MTTVPPPPRHERTRQVAVRLAVVALAVPVLLFTGSSRVVASGLHPGSNPRANVAPSPNFEYSGSCSGAPGAWHCANPCVTTSAHVPRAQRRALVRRLRPQGAQRREGRRAPARPWCCPRTGTRCRIPSSSSCSRTSSAPPAASPLPRAERTAERRRAARSERGHGPGARARVRRRNDASGAPRMGGTWASGMTTLGSDFIWMYADGWGGSLANTPNTACTSPRASGCWAHRDALLGSNWGFTPRLVWAARAARWAPASPCAAAPARTSTSSSAPRAVRRR